MAVLFPAGQFDEEEFEECDVGDVLHISFGVVLFNLAVCDQLSLERYAECGSFCVHYSYPLSIGPTSRGKEEFSTYRGSLLPFILTYLSIHWAS